MHICQSDEMTLSFYTYLPILILTSNLLCLHYNLAVCFCSRARMMLCWLILAIHLPSLFQRRPVENVRPAPPFSVCCS